MQEVICGALLNNAKLVKIKDHTAAGTSTLTSSEVDCRGYSRVLLFTSFGTAAANNLITMHQGATASGEAASVALKASGTSDEDVFLDVRLNPLYPFITLVATCGTSTTCESMWALLYNARTKDQTSILSGTAIGAFFDSPALA
jgi:hypothetical protein